MSLPNDYLERVYAGVLGKLIGVYVGRPFEGWTYQRIMAELGPIEGYVHERLGQPLVVTDDDVAGTFTFLRALEEHGATPDLSAADIGRTWLNNIVENRAILWWGGNGNSTEHTAWLNLKRGLSAPASGSIATNGVTVAEQIGAQIFIDGWAMVAPGQPKLAARLAEQAGKVSHDGEAVHAAMVIAAMEAEAFVSDDMDHLIDTGLSVIPPDCLIARLIGDVRSWRATHSDWRKARQLIEDHYGYDKYPGNCHVVPNHALVIMALLYAPDDFHLAQTIVNTSGWDTDCNAGNVGCLLGIKLGLAGLEGGPDWRGPVADRLLISSADGGGAVTDAVRVSTTIADLGHRLAGLIPPGAPKGGAAFHFSLPGSLQGFQADPDNAPGLLSLSNGGGMLALTTQELAPGQRAAAMTPTFSPPDTPTMRTYDLMASPAVYSGQRLEALCFAAADNPGPLAVGLRVKVYGRDDALVAVDGPSETLAPGRSATLGWTLPDTGGQPIQAIGFVLGGSEGTAAGTLHVDHLGWTGAPDLRLRRPEEPGDFWRQAWVNGVSFFSKNFASAFRISQSVGEGIIIHGARDWRDYEARSTLTVHLGHEGGLAIRVQGLRRYYALVLAREGVVRLVKVRDDERTVLAEEPLDWRFEQPYVLTLSGHTTRLTATLDGRPLFTAEDDAFASGGIGLMINEGALSTSEVHVHAA